jgi:hypothetical protein
MLATALWYANVDIYISDTAKSPLHTAAQYVHCIMSSAINEKAIYGASMHHIK